MRGNPEIASLTYDRVKQRIVIRYVDEASMVLTHVKLDYEANSRLNVVIADGRNLDVRIDNRAVQKSGAGRVLPYSRGEEGDHEEGRGRVRQGQQRVEAP